MTPIKITLLLPLLLSGCAAHVWGGPPPDYPPPPPPPVAARALSRDEVVGIALNYGAGRGYQCFVEEIEREGHHWDVHLGIAPPFRGELAMKIDGWSGEILKAHERFKHGGHHRHWERDGDDDDD